LSASVGVEKGASMTVPAAKKRLPFEKNIKLA